LFRPLSARSHGVAGVDVGVIDARVSCATAIEGGRQTPRQTLRRRRHVIRHPNPRKPVVSWLPSQAMTLRQTYRCPAVDAPCRGQLVVCHPLAAAGATVHVIAPSLTWRRVIDAHRAAPSQNMRFAATPTAISPPCGLAASPQGRGVHRNL
jgi:hypothetical protein